MGWKFNPFTSKQDYYQTAPVLPSITIDFDTADPNTPGTIFTPDDQLNTDALYISAVNNSQWTSNGVAYQTFTPPTSATTPFYLNGTTIDAGSNKTAGIYRLGALVAANFSTRRSTTYTGVSDSNKWWKIFEYNISYTFANDSFKLQMNEFGTAAGTGKSVIFDIVLKRQVASIYLTINVDSSVSNFDLANLDVLYNSTTQKLTFYYRVLTTYTRTNWLVLNASATTTNEMAWYGTLIGTSLSGQTSDPFTTKTIALNKVNGAYTLPTTAPAIGQVLGYSSAGISDWVAGGSSGVCGIANSSGVYTYYATLTLAMTAAVSGQTIELFSDIVETSSVAIALKNGVKLNGNGHTYTLNVNDNTSALTCSSSTFEAFNWKVVRTGRANSSGGYVLNCGGGTFKANGVIMQNTYGTAVFDGIAIYGLNAIGYLDGFTALYENPKHYDCIGESTGTGHGIISTYSVGCIGIAVSGYGMGGNGTHLNSTGISTSGVGMGAQVLTGCIGISTTGIGISASAEGRNCIGISTSGIGGTGIFYESTLISSSNYGCQATLYNSYTQSSSSVATNSSSIYNSTVRCLWDNVGGHCTSTNVFGPREILNSFLEVTNASAYCINGYGGSIWKYSNNSFKGATTAVNATNITQGITNTSDNQGNILI